MQICKLSWIRCLIVISVLESQYGSLLTQRDFGINYKELVPREIVLFELLQEKTKVSNFKNWILKETKDLLKEKKYISWLTTNWTCKMMQNILTLKIWKGTFEIVSIISIAMFTSMDRLCQKLLWKKWQVRNKFYLTRQRWDWKWIYKWQVIKIIWKKDVALEIQKELDDVLKIKRELGK